MKNRLSSPVKIIALVVTCSLALSQFAPALSQALNRPPSLIGYADPFVGTENGGNIVPGAQLPFGFVHVSPDTVNPTTAGYNSYENILGFSQTHVSGTGGASKYGNFLTTPLVGKLRIENLSSPKSEEGASPGYYTVRLTRSHVKAELTATRLVAMHRYTYPASKLSQVLIDVSSVVQPETGKDAIKNPHPVDCWVRVIAPNRIEGSGNFIGGWNQSPYTIHFSTEFDRPFSAFGTWRDNRIEAGTVAAANEGRVGAYATFDTTSNQTVQMKIGVSFISPEKARANLSQEIPNWDFDAVRRQAEAAWESVLGQIRIEGGTDEQRRIFYTALFHSHYMPHDLTGENVWWKSNEPHYEDFYAIWDTFRTHFPNVWSDETRSARPRYADGRWLAPFEAVHFYPDKDYSYWDAPFYEGSGYIYGTYVPHDAQGLINKLGGDDAFITWLDAFFANSPTRDPTFNSGLYNHNNEPDFLAAFLYIHAGRPDRTQERVRRILATEYMTGRGGLPGNDDSGAMSSWYVWGALGLYPNAGQPYYYICSPLFSRSTINLGGGRTFIIEASETSETNSYVQSVTLNGRALDRAWLKHEEIARGGRLVLRMGSTPSAWGRENRPPSMSSSERKSKHE
ncbi:MAG: glycoside hydrolase family 92 protein [Acidobacteria bacterium]|nr:glycoside hydrolase family 92 protein [Acidobacteriota bacterium]